MGSAQFLGCPPESAYKRPAVWVRSCLQTVRETGIQTGATSSAATHTVLTSLGEWSWGPENGPISH